ncbi:MAG: hypothetical protein KDK40_04830 [Chlamydiia bacterium]|nr:hypothetical protein [Chlamydiia bacterium]
MQPRQRRFFTLIELLIVISLLALVGATIAIQGGRILEEQRFYSSTQTLLGRFQIAQGMMLFLGKDMRVVIRGEPGHYSCEMYSDETLSKRLLPLTAPLNLPGIQTITLESDTSQRSDSIKLSFLSNGSSMTRGILRMESTSLGDGSKSAFIVLPGHPTAFTIDYNPKWIPPLPPIENQFMSYPLEIDQEPVETKDSETTTASSTSELSGIWALCGFPFAMRAQKPRQRRRSSFLLLEVLIAMVLILFCLMPLLGPHLTMYLEEKRVTNEVEAVRIVNILFTELLVDKFYRQNIPWSVIADKVPIPIEDPRLRAIGYTAEFQMGIERRQASQPIDGVRHYLLRIVCSLKPIHLNRPFQFLFKLAVAHGGESPQQEDLTEPEEASEEET